MRKKLIQKYKYPSNGINQNLINYLNPNLGSPSYSNSKNDLYNNISVNTSIINGIRIKPIGDALKEDAKRLKGINDATGATTKLIKKAKLTNGLNLANQLIDPALQIGEGLATSAGVTFAEKDALSGGVDALATGLSFLGPWGQVASMGLKGLDTLDRALGKNVKGFDGNLGSSYTNFSTPENKFRLLAWKKANRAEQDKKLNQQFFALGKGIVNEQNQVKDSSLDFKNQLLFNNQFKLNGGFNYNTLMAKNGTKLKFSNIKNSVNNKIKQSKVEEIIEDVEKFEEGGKINVIPEGALHARKHNLPEEIAEFVTDKGIPVITMEEGDEIEQHAEIEVNEIIFNKELTVKLEDMWEQYKNGDDSIAIKAGKLLTYEILENTEDNTGLIDTIEV